MIISLIVAVDEQFGIGKHNQLLCPLPADLRHFKEITMSKPIIMGRKTFESIGKPLPGRQNIVLSRTACAYEGTITVRSLSEAITCCATAEEIMIIGGAEIFQQALPLANRIYLTLIHHQFEADTFFPAINKKEWRCVESNTRPPDEKNKYALTFSRYEQILGK